MALTVAPLTSLPSSDTDYLDQLGPADQSRSPPPSPRTRPWTPAGPAASPCCRWPSARRGCPRTGCCAKRWPGPPGFTSYGPVAGHSALREAAALYWCRRGLPTDAADVVCGPGSKALLFGLLTAIGGDVVVTRPSWVSYAAQAHLAGRVAHFARGAAGVPDPDQLARTVTAARAAGRPVRAVILTLPDNPTGPWPPRRPYAPCARSRRRTI